jgi:hypothetical protein
MGCDSKKNNPIRKRQKVKTHFFAGSVSKGKKNPGGASSGIDY